MYDSIFMTDNERKKLYKKIDRELWEIESYDKIGAAVDENLMEELEKMAEHLEKKLRLDPRQKNLI